MKIPYRCPNCGELEEFYEDGMQDETIYGSRAVRQFIDSTGSGTDSEDIGDFESSDSEYGDWNSNGEGIKCIHCDTDVEEIDDESWDNYAEEAGLYNNPQQNINEGNISDIKKKILGETNET